MEDRFFDYEISYYDEVDRQQSTCYGVTCADTVAEAVENLVQFYGEDNIGSIHVFPLYPNPVYEFNYSENNFSLDYRKTNF